MVFSYRTQQRVTTTLINGVLMFLSILFLLPLLLVISASFSTDDDITKYGYSLIPRHFSLTAYQYLLANPTQIFRAYGVSIFVTLVGSALGLLVMSLLAYALSRRDFGLRRPLSFYVLFTVLFNGGLVPSYILITRYLHLKDTLSVLILPYLVLPFFVLLLRTYFVSLPTELIEAAKIDGASEWRIFFRIVTPLSTPALATVGLFSMLTFWNDWYLALLYTDDKNLAPLQYLLYQILSNITFLSSSTYNLGAAAIPGQTVRMAMAVLAIGPIAFAFLLVQRFFVRGITLGGIRG